MLLHVRRCCVISSLGLVCCFKIKVRRDSAIAVMAKLQAGRTLNPGSILSRVKKLFSQNLQTNYGAQPAFYPVGNWLLRGTNSRSVESTIYCSVMPRLRMAGVVPTWCRAELITEGTLLSRIEGINCEWKARKAETN